MVKTTLIDPVRTFEGRNQLKFIDFALVAAANLFLFILNYFFFSEDSFNFKFQALSFVLTIAIIPPIRMVIGILKLNTKKTGHFLLTADQIEIENAGTRTTFEVNKVDKIVIGKEGNVGDISFKCDGVEHTYYFTLMSSTEKQLNQIMSTWTDRKTPYYFTITPVDKK